MRPIWKSCILLVILCLCTRLSAQEPEYIAPLPPSAAGLIPPVIANKGQFNDSVRFVMLGPQGTAVFAEDGVALVTGQDPPASTKAQEAYLSLLPSEVREAALTRRGPVRETETPNVTRISFVGSDPKATVQGKDRQSATANWLMGRDASKRITGIPVFGGMAYHDLWPGVDLIFKATVDEITCDVQGVDLSGVKLESDAQSLTPAEVGELLSKALGGWTVQKGLRMMIVQQGIFTAGTAYLPVRGDVTRSNGFSGDCFALRADYSSGKVSWITLFGGDGDDDAHAVAVDRHGYVYVTGYTRSEDFPVVGRAYKREFDGYKDYFSARLNPSGTSFAYSTYLGVGAGGLGVETLAKTEKLLAIMIDDGRDEAQITPFLDLGIPLSFALMPWVDPACIRQVKSHGCAPFLHAPMEALGSVNTHSEEIRATQTEAQVGELLEGWLAWTPGVVGISNHRGSAATSDPETMRRVAAFAKKHGLMFFDSNTSPVSVAPNVCRDMNVPCLQQDFFLDDKTVAGVRAHLLAMADLAERTGYATCICHVGRDVVPEAIRTLIPELQARGFRFVTVPELYKELKRE